MANIDDNMALAREVKANTGLALDPSAEVTNQHLFADPTIQCLALDVQKYLERENERVRREVTELVATTSTGWIDSAACIAAFEPTLNAVIVAAAEFEENHNLRKLVRERNRDRPVAEQEPLPPLAPSAPPGQEHLCHLALGTTSSERPLEPNVVVGAEMCVDDGFGHQVPYATISGAAKLIQTILNLKCHHSTMDAIKYSLLLDFACAIVRHMYRRCGSKARKLAVDSVHYTISKQANARDAGACVMRLIETIVLPMNWIADLSRTNFRRRIFPDMIHQSHVKELTSAELDDFLDRAWHKTLAVVRVENIALLAKTVGCAEMGHKELIKTTGPMRNLYDSLLAILGVHNMRQSTIEVAIGRRLETGTTMVLTRDGIRTKSSPTKALNLITAETLRPLATDLNRQVRRKRSRRDAKPKYKYDLRMTMDSLLRLGLFEVLAERFCDPAQQVDVLLKAFDISQQPMDLFHHLVRYAGACQHVRELIKVWNEDGTSSYLFPTLEIIAAMPRGCGDKDRLRDNLQSEEPEPEWIVECGERRQVPVFRNRYGEHCFTLDATTETHLQFLDPDLIVLLLSHRLYLLATATTDLSQPMSIDSAVGQGREVLERHSRLSVQGPIDAEPSQVDVMDQVRHLPFDERVRVATGAKTIHGQILMRRDKLAPGKNLKFVAGRGRTKPFKSFRHGQRGIQSIRAISFCWFVTPAVYRPVEGQFFINSEDFAECAHSIYLLGEVDRDLTELIENGVADARNPLKYVLDNHNTIDWADGITGDDPSTDVTVGRTLLYAKYFLAELLQPLTQPFTWSDRLKNAENDHVYRWQQCFAICAQPIACVCERRSCIINQSLGRLVCLTLWLCEVLNDARANGRDDWNISTFGFLGPLLMSQFTKIWLEDDAPRPVTPSTDPNIHYHEVDHIAMVRRQMSTRSRHFALMPPEPPVNTRFTTSRNVKLSPSVALTALLNNGRNEQLWPRPRTYDNTQCVVLPRRRPPMEYPLSPMNGFKKFDQNLTYSDGSPKPDPQTPEEAEASFQAAYEHYSLFK